MELHKEEKIEIVPLYFAKKRKIIRKDKNLIPLDNSNNTEENVEEVLCRFRTWLCSVREQENPQLRLLIQLLMRQLLLLEVREKQEL